MPDWTGLLDSISGGAFGITKGLTAGAEPYKAWEGVRTADLANDRSEITLRDLQLMQQALEAQPDFYGNAATARNTANQLATSKGKLDIFGNERNLDINQQLSDPMGMFQQATAGLTPADPEYRQLYAQFLGYLDPTGAMKSYDSFGVEKMQQRGINEQAVYATVLQMAQMQDPGATLQRKPDGTIVVLASDGEEMPVSPKLLTKVAAMLGAPTPIDAYYKGLTSEQGIQNTNINLFKALDARGISPTKALASLDQLRIGYDKDIAAAMAQVNTILKSDEYKSESDPAARAEMLREPMRRAETARANKEKVMAMYAQVAVTSNVPGSQPLAPPTPRVAPTGGTKVTTRSPQATGAKAAGIAPRPAGPMRPGETGGPIGGVDLFGIQQDPMGAFIDSLGIQ
jgi:hypothetical protein